MDLTDNGRYAIGSVALIVIGFSLGQLTQIQLAAEAALAMMGTAATFLLLSARRPRNGGTT